MVLNDLVRHVFLFFARLGGFGLLGLGILDSSILFMPLGNDLLLVALTIRNPQLVLYFIAMATIGSVLGCAITGAASRKAGEAGLENRIPKNRLESVQKRMKNHAWWALVVASLMPPPFPFTVFVIVAAALQYPRSKLFTAVAFGRSVRFGALATFPLKIPYLSSVPS